jgi:hypothetical protein
MSEYVDIRDSAKELAKKQGFVLEEMKEPGIYRIVSKNPSSSGYVPCIGPMYVIYSWLEREERRNAGFGWEGQIAKYFASIVAGREE